MFNDDTWIKLWRKTLNWQWWTDPVVAHLYITMLLKVNIKGSYWQGVYIPAGSFVSSYRKLALESGLTVKQVRRAIKSLSDTQEVAHKGHSKYTVFTVLSWESYQTTRAHKGQTEGTQRASKGQQNKNNNNIKEDKRNIEGSAHDSVNEKTEEGYIDARSITLEEFRAIVGADNE